MNYTHINIGGGIILGIPAKYAVLACKMMECRDGIRMVAQIPDVFVMR